MAKKQSREVATTYVWITGLAMAVVGCGPTEVAIPTWCSSESSEPEIAFDHGQDRALTLTEAWRRGGLVEGEELAQPYDVPAIDERGRIALIDFGHGAVMGVGEDSEWRGPIIRQGEGPRELELPAVVRWATDGSLLVIDVGRTEITRRDFSTGDEIDSSPVPSDAFRRVSLAGEIHWGSIALGPTGELLLAFRERVGQDPNDPVRAELLRYPANDPNGKPQLLAVVESQPVTARRTLILPGAPRPFGASGPDGVVAVAGDIDRYRIRVVDAAGSDSLLICRDADALPLARIETGDTMIGGNTDSPLDRELREIRNMLADAPRTASPIPMGRLFYDATGRLWVQRERENPVTQQPPVGANYDVFDSAGVYAGTVTAPDGVVLYGESEQWVIGYEIGDLDETSIVAYEVGG